MLSRRRIQYEEHLRLSMRPFLATSHGRRRRERVLGALFISGAAALLIACGVTLGSTTPTSEFFRSLTITGDFSAGSQLTLEVQYAQSYPVAVDVVCDLLEPGRPTPTPSPAPTSARGSARAATATPVRIPKPSTTPANRVFQIAAQNVGANEQVPTVIRDETLPEVTPVTGSITRQFAAPEQPGRYVARCYTPADDNNQVRKTIRIRPAS